MTPSRRRYDCSQEAPADLSDPRKALGITPMSLAEQNEELLLPSTYVDDPSPAWTVCADTDAYGATTPIVWTLSECEGSKAFIGAFPTVTSVITHRLRNPTNIFSIVDASDPGADTHTVSHRRQGEFCEPLRNLHARFDMPGQSRTKGRNPAERIGHQVASAAIVPARPRESPSGQVGK
ncbi:uncharacterized protein L969DRAFT_48890 [Mixia osmundae IAM 14324]|uniref:Uncharacterized protein n=1 Tax=Mixia osmundae (strain CBS 9802 / IAM 14324 / JCM 22182 / KY 12970) TaxID=764103 RepID=G7DVU9_MIXOS|nr:uncharacterized protein L969DRAFT_48890 [Mixia osmundae IAM 14324]KEI39612.1 hypothetical protein L969DRAFT_48890 [Mixia osmundae IAM 14324]GAA94709.1 hypothetical protein E5Q_01362 [Mixia osmundae IAM 14324]